jgi:hypothetical protein
MTETIIVSEQDDTLDIDFANLSIRHKSCGSAEMRKSRNPASNLYSLECDCGFSLNFLDEHTAISNIAKVSITKQENTLMPGSFYSQSCETCLVVCE